jgi:uncharacterized protein
VNTYALTMIAGLILPLAAAAQDGAASRGEGTAPAVAASVATPEQTDQGQSNESLVAPVQTESQTGPGTERSGAVTVPAAESAQEDADLAAPADAAAPDAEESEEVTAEADPTPEASTPVAPAPDAEEGTEVAAEADPTPDAPQELAEAAPEPVPDPDISACLSTAGPASAGVPAGAADAAARRAALAAAAEVCTAAAEADDAPAEVLFLAAEIAQGQRDLARAFELLERAAAAGFGPAETRLGDYYLFGLAPGGEDADAAISHYEAAVALDDAPGKTTLALMHRVGKGVPRDPVRMVALLDEAAQAGYHFAQYRLAQTYLTGEGIPGRRDATLGIPDPARAADLYTDAAEAGNITAALELAALYADPASGLAENPAEQARLTLMASRAGLPDATAAMAVLYETGRGVEKNPDVAALLYVKALETGKVGFDAMRQGAPGPWDFETAVAFQKILQERGLYNGALDGVIGPGSAAGARALAGN